MSTDWICIDQTPDRIAAARVEALLRDRGVPVRVRPSDSTADELEVQVPAREFERAIAELADLDGADEDERRD